MEILDQLRQMMADHLYFEAQKIIENQLTANLSQRFEVLDLYEQCLRAQEKKMDNQLIIELSQYWISLKDFEKGKELLRKVSDDKLSHEVMKLRLLIYEQNGEISNLHECILKCLEDQIVFNRPLTPKWCLDPIRKYFSDDLEIKIKIIQIAGNRKQLDLVENLVQEYLLYIYERKTIKDKEKKIQDLSLALNKIPKGNVIEIYRNLLEIILNGIREKSQIKRLIEFILYFDNVKFQLLILFILDREQLSDEARLYSQWIQRNKKLDRTYVNRVYKNIKNYFGSQIENSVTEVAMPEIDLTLEESEDTAIDENVKSLKIPEQVFANNLTVITTFSCSELNDLCVGYLQAEMPQEAFNVASLSQKNSKNDEDFLKATYLKITILATLAQYRLVIDETFEALSRSTGQDEILSFLYAQADAYYYLGEKEHSNRILNQILKIQPAYRKAREKLERI